MAENDVMVDNDQYLPQNIKIKRLANKVMQSSKSSLIVHMRFLDAAINKLKLETAEKYISVDGRAIMYNPLYVLRLYKKDKNLVTRAYLHMILHCTFLHFYVGPQINQNLWDIACDIAVENILDQLAQTEEYLQIEPDPDKERAMEKIRANVDKLTAEKIYRYLLDSDIPEEEMEEMFFLFAVDNHACWYDMQHKPQELTKDDMKKEEKPPMIDDSPNPDDENPQPDDDAESEEDSQLQDDDSTNKEAGEDGRNASEEEMEEMGDDGNQEVDKDKQELMDEWEDVAKHMDLDMETFSKEAGSRVGDLLLNLRNVTRENTTTPLSLKNLHQWAKR